MFVQDFFLNLCSSDFRQDGQTNDQNCQGPGAQGYLQVGWNIPLVAEKVGRHKSVISRLAKKAREMGEERAMVRKPGVAGEIWQPLLTSRS